MRMDVLTTDTRHHRLAGTESQHLNFFTPDLLIVSLISFYGFMNHFLNSYL